MEGELDISAGSTTPKKVKKKTKEGKKIKKPKTVVEEEPDCEPPVPKKKKKEKVHKANGDVNKSIDVNGNIESPLKNTSYSNEESADNDKATEKKKTSEDEVVNRVLPKTPKLIAQTNGHSTTTTPAQSSEDSGSDDETETETPEQKEGAFSNFRISPNTIKLLQARGISFLFDIQTQTFNSVYEGKDVIGQARTGTGKTLAFAIPLIEKIQNDPDDKRRGRAPKVLCLAPTRELAIQVAKDFKDMTKKLSVTCFYGGSSYNPQLDAIRSGIDVLVGTPGRIKDHLQNNKLDLSQLKHVVLDEVDQMLDMGFAEQVEEILSASYQKDSESNPQTLLFSATCPPWVYVVAKKYMRPTYEHVDLIGKKTQKAATTVEHLAIACHWSQRAAVIGDVVQVYSGSHGRTIVFCETKKDANELSMNTSIKQSSQSLHGDIPQKQREITLKGFRSGTFEVLVATNVAARGLDIPEVDLVVQCSPPKDVESYIHRSGRTGRAGRTGVCICFYQRKEEDQLRYVEQKAGITFKRVGVPTANDIIKSSSKDAVRFLDSVPPQAIEYFRVSATKLIEERGAVDALAAALAHISGATALEQRSLLNSDAVSLQAPLTHTCSFSFPQDAWQDGRRWQLSIATELPELEEKQRMGGDRGDRGYGRSFGGRGGGGRGGGRGFRNGGGGGNWRGGGGSHKRSFSSAFDY
uniref:RNA helicase n=1 Tax=Hucho hucho TaxID=62062 RepID=A0A4W5R6I5_9TELE